MPTADEDWIGHFDFTFEVIEPESDSDLWMAPLKCEEPKMFGLPPALNRESLDYEIRNCISTLVRFHFEELGVEPGFIRFETNGNHIKASVRKVYRETQTKEAG